ncbi:MAG: hypothetical protein A3F41_06615 [Coxiella sp. RIFCSPHIGHO2_12_FULL_44_14]|nr:MAG: hypothetical protein A3F41_06615 [Coxiella sp. RIFCSPHIGHO2_12_FULL_44_14]
MKSALLPVLSQWNRWGGASLHSGYPRSIIKKTLPFLNTPEIITLVGLRRCGKTTLLYQIMDVLEKQGILPEAMLHMNFEEPAIALDVKLEILDELYQTYRREIYPQGKAFLFFDEIQNVPGWERWARARNDSEEIKIFITGSSAHLMSRELGTVLTGRHVEFYLSSLSFLEYLHFKNIAIPKKMLKTDPSPLIQNALKQYLTWGGLPEIVLSENVDRKRVLLKQYLDDILFKDVAMRHQIRDIVLLRNMAIHLITHTACLTSINRLAKIFEISLETVANYCHFLQESFLIDFLPYFSLKTAERMRNPQKIHVCDLGFRQVMSFSNSPDYGKLAETLVYQQLQRQYRGDIFYWKGVQEVDFVVRKGNDIHRIIQVAYDVPDNTDTWQREMTALEEAEQRFPHASSTLLVGQLPKMHNKRLLPLWHQLLGINESA